MAHDVLENARGRELLRAELERLRAREVPRAHAVVTHDEVNERHGTGILVRRLLAGRDDIVSIRAEDHYGGEHVLGRAALRLPDAAADRPSIYRWTLEATRGMELASVLCVPLGARDLTVALALRDAHAASLCLYVMDDQNVEAGGIPDDLMAEAIGRATLRFAISSDMRVAYEAKYGRRFWILPPTLTPGVTPGRARPEGRRRGVVVGNVWGRAWLGALRAAVREAGLEVDWYANAPRGGWLDVDASELLDDGVRLLDPLPPYDLARRLRDYSFTLMPSAPRLGEEGHAVAALSLPSRIATIVSATELPIVVLGDARSCAARFVSFFGIGAACDYEGRELGAALERFEGARARAALEAAVRDVRQRLDMADLPGWLERSIAAGRPASSQFEDLEVLPPLHIRPFVSDAPGLGPWMHAFDGLVDSLSRLAATGWQPSFVIDGGSSSGVWSDVVSRHFPLARYVLVDPLEEHYDAAPRALFRERLPDALHVQSALGAAPGTATLHLDTELYGSSLIAGNVGGETSELSVPVTTLDAIAADAGLAPGGLLKLDLQGAEIAALEGGQRTLADLVDVVMVEVTLDPSDAAVPSWTEVDRRLTALGFHAWDAAGEWRDPGDGRLRQMDLVYVRSGALS